MHRHVICAVTIWVVFWPCMSLRSAVGETTDADRELVQKVASQIFAAAEPLEKWAWSDEWAWPPIVEIVDETTVNAHATLISTGKGAERKFQPKIVVYQGYLDKVVVGKEERLAQLLGHELSHILLKHVAQTLPGTPLVGRALSREDEIAADVLGVKLAIKACYPYAGVIGGMKRMRDVTAKETPFERLDATHPSTVERLAIIDTERRTLWQAMSAFENGCYFLICEQYGLAERCFRQVVKEFPDCYEGWANLGYARLMMYCDALSPDDLRSFDLGQLVVGGFYRRPTSLEPVRGVDEDLWFEAVGALREALRLQPDLILVKANLAMTYLVRPAGKDVGRAAELFDEVTQVLEKGAVNEDLDPVTRASLLINAGVSELANGRPEQGERFFRMAELLLQAPAEKAQRPVSDPLLQAVSYNRALVLSGSNEPDRQRSAMGSLERYLSFTGRAGAWWPLAYERYAKLCEKLQVNPKSADELPGKRPTSYRLLTHLTLDGGEIVALTDRVGDVVSRLGVGLSMPVLSRSTLRRLRFTKSGIDLLATDHQVIAICLQSSDAPAIELQPTEMGGAPRSLKIGMSRQDLEAIVGVDGYDYRELLTEGADYRYYRSLGLAVRIEYGVVRELVIAQIPEEK